MIIAVTEHITGEWWGYEHQVECCACIKNSGHVWKMPGQRGKYFKYVHCDHDYSIHMDEDLGVFFFFKMESVIQLKSPLRYWHE